MKFRLKQILPFLALIALLALPACAAQKTSGSGFAMGSVLTVDLYGPEDETARLRQEILAAVSGLDKQISATDPESAVSALNRGETRAADAETLALLRETRALCEESGGALDVTLGAATALWGFATDSPALPDPEVLAAAMQTAGLDKFTIDEGSNAVILSPGTRLDLGAVGKGAGADAALSILQKAHVPAVINFGGTVLLYGKPAGKRAWTVGLRDPFGAPTDLFATVAFAPEAADDAIFLSTSGGYEKQFTVDGTVYHHILDPKTGYPADAAPVSVTVIAARGLTCDALSTACFILGEGDASRSLLRQHDAEAVFVYPDGGVSVTPGLEGRIELTREGFYLHEEHA